MLGNKLGGIMNCKNCPYCEIQIDDIYCNKVGGRISLYGTCSECEDDSRINFKKCDNKRKRNKRERYLKHQNHLKHLYETVGGYYPTPVMYTDEIWRKGYYVQNPKPYYKRLYRPQYSGFAKQQSNKMIRRYKGELHNGYHHIHKIYDYWWRIT